MSTTDGWLKLNFASWVVRKTRSLGALAPCSICIMVFVNYIYDMVVAQFHKFHGRPFARVLNVFLMKIEVGDSPGCHQGQQENFARTILS